MAWRSAPWAGVAEVAFWATLHRANRKEFSQ